MKVLLIGSGGREHTLAEAIINSPLCNSLFVAPGNYGTHELGATNVDIKVTEFSKMEDLINKEAIDLIVVGPEAPLVEGIYDHFTKLGIPVVGPSAEAAQLEGSKAYAKKFMQSANIPTAGYIECNANNLDAGLNFLEKVKPPYVLKADGLAAGKGVLIIDNLDEAKAELKNMLDGKFGSASATVVIEEFLSGIEFSVFALTDGKNYLLLPEAKDYKRIGEGDTGLNTGGMGAVSPVPFFNETMRRKVIDRIVEPTINELAKQNLNYKGFVFFGLIDVAGEPFVIEYNCRMGDPETEVVIPRIKNDILPILASLSTQSLDQHHFDITDETAVTVMAVAGGYPGDYTNGLPITLKTSEHSKIYHAGTKLIGDQVCTAGGRVLSVTSLGDDIQSALDKSYATLKNIAYVGMYYRNDIGQDLIKLQKS
jgi:phosphoribosylamine---glycine ligase